MSGQDRFALGRHFQPFFNFLGSSKLPTEVKRVVATRNGPTVYDVALHKAFRFAVFIGAFLSAACSGVGAASSQGWDRLPDGRVVIELKDVRVALPATGPDTELITFTDRLQIKNKMTLKEVVERPDAARRLFEGASLIFVSLPNVMDRQGLFLGKFPRSEFRSVGAGFAIGKGALADCESWGRTFSGLAGSLKPNDPRLETDGWAEFKLSENLGLTAYVRSSQESEKPFFPGMSCNYFKGCSSTKCIAADLTVSYGFSSNIIERREWLPLDRKMHELLKYIFVDLMK